MLSSYCSFSFSRLLGIDSEWLIFLDIIWSSQNHSRAWVRNPVQGQDTMPGSWGSVAHEGNLIHSERLWQIYEPQKNTMVLWCTAIAATFNIDFLLSSSLSRKASAPWTGLCTGSRWWSGTTHGNSTWEHIRHVYLGFLCSGVTCWLLNLLVTQGPNFQAQVTRPRLSNLSVHLWMKLLGLCRSKRSSRNQGLMAHFEPWKQDSVARLLNSVQCLQNQWTARTTGRTTVDNE